MQNRYDATTQQYTLTNVCEHAGIYGLDGTPWATSAGLNLTTYQFDLLQEDDSIKKVTVDEFKTALEGSKGNRKGSEAGIRMGNQKYMFVKHNPDVNSVYLAREGGGGACVARTNTAVVIGIWNKSQKMSNG